MNRILLVDGNNIAARAWHTGNPYGFFNMVLTISEELRPTHAAFVFDNGQKNWRYDAYPEYKARRKPSDPAMVEFLVSLQWHLASHLKAFAYPEADDGLGTLARLAEGLGFEVFILSSDKDMLQLITDSIRVVNFGFHFSDRRVLGFGDVLPKNLFLSYRALVGDSSDNLPGVRGVGPKTASALISRFGNIANIYNCISSCKPGVAKKLDSGRAFADLTYRLSVIRQDLPCSFVPEECLWDPDRLHSVSQELREWQSGESESVFEEELF